MISYNTKNASFERGILPYYRTVKICFLLKPYTFQQVRLHGHDKLDDDVTAELLMTCLLQDLIIAKKLTGIFEKCEIIQKNLFLFTIWHDGMAWHGTAWSSATSWKVINPFIIITDHNFIPTHKNKSSYFVSLFCYYSYILSHSTWLLWLVSLLARWRDRAKLLFFF